MQPGTCRGFGLSRLGTWWRHQGSPQLQCLYSDTRSSRLCLKSSTTGLSTYRRHCLSTAEFHQSNYILCRTLNRAVNLDNRDTIGSTVNVLCLWTHHESPRLKGFRLRLKISPYGQAASANDQGRCRQRKTTRANRLSRQTSPSSLRKIPVLLKLC